MSAADQLAATFAEERHGEQRYGPKPYRHHLESVVSVLHRFGHDEPALTDAAWLHDTLEDTDATCDDLRERFGSTVAAIVQAVTTEPGASREERHKLTYPKIAANPDAIIVKQADRIANVEASVVDNPEKLAMYRDEYPGFRRALAGHGGDPAMWAHLDGLLALRRSD